jgi:hypothetical protein
MNHRTSTMKELSPMNARLGKVVLTVVVALHAGLAWAGTSERMGTGGSSELRIPIGARTVALAWSNLGSTVGAEALFTNPAGLAATEHGTEVMFSYAKYIADMNLNYIAVAQKMGGFGSLGFTAKVLSVGDIIRTTETAPDGTGDVFHPNFATLGLSYAKSITDRVNFGGTMAYTSETVLQTKSNGVSFDFGFQYDTGFHGLKIGGAMKNFGASQEFSGSDFESNQQIPEDDPQAANRTVALSSAAYELPAQFAGGASWPVLQGQNTLMLHGIYQSNSYGVDELRLGGEFEWKKVFAVRLGYRYTSDSSDLWGMTYGAGAQIPFSGGRMRIDYAGQMVSNYFDDVHHIGLGFEF